MRYVAGRPSPREGLARTRLAGVLVTALCVGLLLAVPATAQGASACAAGTSLNIVAHTDDTLLFQGSNVIRDIRAGRCVRTVFATAGDDNLPEWYWSSREEGARAAYAQIAGVENAWLTQDAGAPGQRIVLATLRDDPKISLEFLRLPDGYLDGRGGSNYGYQSLQKLYQNVIGTITSVDGRPSYTKASLLSTLVWIMQDFRPDNINTLDYVGAYGDADHSDHSTIAYLTQQAQAQYTTAHGFAGYQGYATANRPTNVIEPYLTEKRNAFFTYAAYDYRTCASAAACSSRPEGAWLSREYTVGTPTTTPPGVDPPPPVVLGVNVAGSATVTASSENPADGQSAAAAVDGVIDGYPGDYRKEWATRGGRAGSWLNLVWSSPVTLGTVQLYDRPNLSDGVTSGTLTFSDGSTVTVPSLPNGGGALTVSFTPRNTSSLRFTVTGVSTTTVNIGLAEISAWTPSGVDPPPPVVLGVNVAGSATVTASSENPADGQSAAAAVDGVIDGYPGDYRKEWATRGGRADSWLNLVWSSPVTLGTVQLYDRPNLSDGVTSGTLTFSDGSTVTVPSLPNGGGALTVSFTPRNTSSLRFTVTGVSTTTVNIGLAEISAWTPSE